MNGYREVISIGNRRPFVLLFLLLLLLGRKGKESERKRVEQTHGSLFLLANPAGDLRW